jgi:hypothetical protein
MVNLRCKGRGNFWDGKGDICTICGEFVFYFRKYKIIKTPIYISLPNCKTERGFSQTRLRKSPSAF